jgi:dCTP diphosphatase
LTGRAQASRDPANITPSISREAFAGLADRPGVIMSDLHQLRDAVRQFSAERDWGQFHSPKNLAMALSVEAAELMEHFQWLTEAESAQLSEAQKRAVAHEMADVFIYLLQLSDRVGVDLIAAAREKMKLNAEKYPVDKARGSLKKYDAL